jgi:hypothetical protein
MTAVAKFHAKLSPAVRRLVPGWCESCGRQFFYRRIGRPRIFCDQKCRQSGFRRPGYLPSKIDEGPQKTQVSSRVSDPDFSDRPSRSWRIVAGPKLSPSELHAASVGAEGVIEANNRVNAEYWHEHNAKAEAACLIKRYGPPANVVGGHKFPNTPAIDLVSRSNQPTPQLQRLNDLLSQIPDDLSIPPFLKRRLVS